MSSKNSHNDKRKKNKEGQKKEKNKKLIMQLVISGCLIVAAYFLIPKFFGEKEENKEDNKIKTFTPYSFNKEGEVTFRNVNDEFITKIDVELAENDAERSQGLMFRIDLRESQGMLFAFPYENYQSFWMKNTAISLDMIFVNKNFEIVKIHKNTTPYSEESYPSGKPAKYVVEVVSGFTDKHDIKEGDNIVWRAN
ncbi:MAG: DUF192 domain-containing protein [Ignavibacteria bacterium]|jgi:uncharacterized membrane protein (UPF0127 family)